MTRPQEFLRSGRGRLPQGCCSIAARPAQPRMLAVVPTVRLRLGGRRACITHGSRCLGRIGRNPRCDVPNGTESGVRARSGPREQARVRRWRRRLSVVRCELCPRSPGALALRAPRAVSPAPRTRADPIAAAGVPLPLPGGAAARACFIDRAGRAGGRQARRLASPRIPARHLEQSKEHLGGSRPAAPADGPGQPAGMGAVTRTPAGHAPGSVLDARSARGGIGRELRLAGRICLRGLSSRRVAPRWPRLDGALPAGAWAPRWPDTGAPRRPEPTRRAMPASSAGGGSPAQRLERGPPRDPGSAAAADRVALLAREPDE